MRTLRTPANNFAIALKSARKLMNLSQEDFGLVSSRTYISSLERGLGSPTLSKVDELAAVLGVHPLTLLFLAYAPKQSSEQIENLHDLVLNEVKGLGELAR
ncbi:MAG: hypothetical protein CFE43_02005 [Burkholderiales bacterium PBB3]|nr:MAG: hypothetical protein CFE43_02005 [Burkholderiales bacterium PBB3]